MRLEESGSGLPNRATDLEGEIPQEILGKLTPRQRDVLVEWVKDPNVRRIAKRLELSPGTVANHLTRIRQHLGVQSQVELMLLVTRRPPHPPQSQERIPVQTRHQLIDSVRGACVHCGWYRETQPSQAGVNPNERRPKSAEARSRSATG